jgi:RimJ/RimL family protein N-acetyltransferase
MPAPVLHTERLTLRPHVMADFEPLCAVFESARARYMGGPFSRREAWLMFAADAGSWALQGVGAWGIQAREGAFLGQVSVAQPVHFPELELGWTLVQEAEGQGYAHEAAMAALNWVRCDLRPQSLVSYVHVDNARSIALARRLGAEHDPCAAYAEGDSAEDTVIYRHHLDSDGSPEAYA